MDFLQWFAPDASDSGTSDSDVVTLATRPAFDQPVVMVEPEVAGLGAAPREVTRTPLSTGGAWARWAYATERVITLPVSVWAPTRDGYRRLIRRVTTAFTASTPPAGTPRSGRLRVYRDDDSWREAWCVYESGLEGEETPGSDATWARRVIQLVAADPWWYGPDIIALRFEPDPTLSYLNPYQTVSPDVQHATHTIDIEGDVPVAPVWTITGPSASLTIRLEHGPGMRLLPLEPGKTIVIDTAAGTITDHHGRDRISLMVWPESEMFTLPPGENGLVLSLLGGIADQSAIELAYRPRYETA